MKTTMINLGDVFVEMKKDLVGALVNMVKNEHDALDIYQNTFIKCLKNQDRIPELNEIRSWIFQIAINTARDFHRSAWKRKRESLYLEGELIPAREEKEDQEEELELIRQATNLLKKKDKEIFLLKQSMTCLEISQAAKIPLGTVKTRIKRSLAQIRKLVLS